MQACKEPVSDRRHSALELTSYVISNPLLRSRAFWPTGTLPGRSVPGRPERAHDGRAATRLPPANGGGDSRPSATAGDRAAGAAMPLPTAESREWR